MEEEVSYASVVFKNGRQPPQVSVAEKYEDGTVYAEVKHPRKVSAAALIQVEAKETTNIRLLLVCLGFLCVILIGSSAAIVYLGLNLRDVSAENQKLTDDKRVLQSLTEQLSDERRKLQNHSDSLNSTLEVIMKFRNFPVNDFCPDKKCQPCRKGWIQYNKKCYLFYEESPWKTWTESRQYCRDKEADLVVIDDLQEQEFIGQKTEFYFDEHHGFWMGLQKKTNWVWINGQEDTLQYWRNLDEKLYGLMIPGTNATHSWISENVEFLNKFICEDDKILMRSD